MVRKAKLSPIPSASKSLPASSYLVLNILRVCIEQKALDVRALDIRARSSISDYIVIASATSQRHLRGIADKVRKAIHENFEHPSAPRSEASSDWILLDYRDVLVNIFYEPVRQYYQFDELWKDSPQVPLEPELEQAAKKLRTGLLREV